MKICAWCDQDIHPDELAELYDQPVHTECVEEAKYEAELDAHEQAEREFDGGEWSSAYIENWRQHREQH